jgi:hypothetical protein
LQEILTHPQIGGFDPNNVIALTNPNVSEMRTKLGEVFARCSNADLVLLYFTGHGVTDQYGDFYFTTCETQKFDDNALNRGTAVDASFVREEMRKCPSRRQVAILDCCFSGAFPDGVAAMDDQTVDVERQLGGEGRAILTAATSTQYALEQTGEELSVYTRYLVDGLKTGAAVPDGEEFIQVGHLHDYIRDKLKTAAAAMSPQIYAARDGREIVLAKAVIDNELRYRKLVKQYLREDGQVKPLGRRILRRQVMQLGITPEQAEAIEFDVCQPFRERHENLQEFEDAYREAIEDEYPFSAQTEQEIRDYQHLLKLRDEDVAKIAARLQGELGIPPSGEAGLGDNPPPVGASLGDNPSSEPQPAAKPAPTPSTNEIEISLESEKGVDYQELQRLLAAGEWKQADNETYLRMLEAVGRKKGDWIRAEELKQFPCKDLKTIDRLWVHYSGGQFGFSVQKKIYVECGAKLDGNYPGDTIWDEFCDRVGWRVNDEYIYYKDVNFNTSASEGHLPLARLGEKIGWRVFSLLSHIAL